LSRPVLDDPSGMRWCSVRMKRLPPLCEPRVRSVR
jgi:hypothetical protein